MHPEPAEGRGQPPGISSVLSWRFTEKTYPGDQATLHPHPRVTAVAKIRNRRAACPLPQTKRARDLRSGPRSFDFVHVAHFAPKEKPPHPLNVRCAEIATRFSLGVSCRGSPRDLLRMTVSANRAGKSAITFYDQVLTQDTIEHCKS